MQLFNFIFKEKARCIVREIHRCEVIVHRKNKNLKLFLLTN